MNTKNTCVVPSIVLLALCSAANPSLADPVADWNNAAREAIRVARTDPPRASRGLAMLHIAMYDAVNGIQRTHRPYHVTALAPGGASVDAAVSAAAYEVLLEIFPSNGIQTTNLAVLYSNLVAAIPDSQAKEDGLQWGKTVGTAIVQLRANDGSTNLVAYTPTIQPGRWRPTPPANGAALLPGWGQVTPFAMTALTQFQPYLPPPLSGSGYAFELNVVKAYGAATGSVRTAEQTLIADFWANGAGTETPPGHWNRIALDVAAAQSLDLPGKARLMALVNIALADSAIACWECKFAFDYWRPVTAIREADTDDNPDTVPDPAWSSYVATPPFPEYTSGHSTFSRAAATVMAGFFGTDAISFTTTSDGLPGVNRSYPGLGAAADESGVSRIYGGIHFPSANIAGQTTGHLLAQHVMSNYLLALEAPAFVLVAPGAGDVRVQLIGTPGRAYALEACSDLQNWVEVGTATANANGEVEFIDSGAAGADKRFYRALAR